MDPYEIEYRLVRLRNRAQFILGPKGDRERPRVFIVGHPHTATTILAELFGKNGYHTQHTAGRWRTQTYECFADRGNYRPLDFLKACYPNSTFILNTRPSLHFLRNRADRLVRKSLRKGGSRPGFSERYFQGELQRRNAFFMEFIREFHGESNFLVFNIERSGGFEFVAERMGLEGAPAVRAYSGGRQLTEEDVQRIEGAYEDLGIASEQLNPFVIPALLNESQRQQVSRFLADHADRIHL